MDHDARRRDRADTADGEDRGDEATFELHLGAEHVEVIVDAWGIRFRHPDREGAEGRLTWDAALALSLLPRERMPSRARAAVLPRG